MPVYEYRCTKGHTYEKTESFSAPSAQKCTKCNARARRQISMPAVIFKGSGFYSTDNRGSPPSSDGGSSSTSSDNGKSATKSDSASSNDSASKTEASVD